MRKKSHFIPHFLHNIHNLILNHTRSTSSPYAKYYHLRNLSIDDHAYLLHLYLDRLFHSLINDDLKSVSIGEQYGSFSLTLNPDGKFSITFSPSPQLKRLPKDRQTRLNKKAPA